MNSRARRRRYPRVIRFANGSIICGSGQPVPESQRYRGCDVRWFDVAASLAYEMTPRQGQALPSGDEEGQMTKEELLSKLKALNAMEPTHPYPMLEESDGTKWCGVDYLLAYIGDEDIEREYWAKWGLHG